MRVLYIFQYFNTPSVPGGTRAYEMARRLVARGHDVTLITSDYRRLLGPNDPCVRMVDGIRVVYTRVPYSSRMGYLQRMFAFMSFALRSTWHAIHWQPDVVFASSTPLTVAIPAMLAKSRWRVPMVFEIRDLWPHVPIQLGVLKDPLTIALAKWLERTAYRSSSRIVALSPGMARGVCSVGISPGLVEVIPNAADLELFGRQLEDTDIRELFAAIPHGPVVLYAGAIGPANDVRYLVDLATATTRICPTVRFVVLGDGPQRADVVRYAKERNAWASSFFLFDRVPKNQMPRVLAASSVVTSLFADIEALNDNSANKFFDGLAAGRPVAINHGGWQADLLEKHAAGFQLARDVDRAARTLCEWLQDPERLESAGRNARALAESEFSRDHLALRLERVLLDAVGRRPSG